MLYGLFLETKYKTHDKLNKTQREKQTQGATMETKECTNCEKVKPLNEFDNKKDSKDGKQGYCKICNREKSAKWQKENPERHKENMLRNKYGLTISMLERLIEGQDGRCLVCTNVLQEGRKVHIDHCHTEGHIRGVLCNHCNLGLGHFKDNPGVLRRAAEYLEGN